MEPEVVKIERRGRKRKRKDGDAADKTGKKTVVETRAKVLVGRYVKKEFEESGEFLGKIVSYDSGLYRVDYEDGDCEDLETREVKLLIVKDNEMDAAFHRRKKALDEHISKKYAKLEAAAAVAAAKKVETVRSESGGVCNGVELANAVKVENSSIRGGAFEVSGAQAEIDGGESSSDFSDDEQPSVVVEPQPPLPPPPELPPSSGNFGVSEEHVSYLLSVYSFLRSYSVCLFLSPFRLDEFVGALNSPVPTTLLDAVHVALIRALKSHIEILSSEGSELASKCLRVMDWSLLDSLTWPVFIVQYLSTMRYAEGPEWKEFYINVLEKSYYSLSAGRKLIVLQLLCDAALDSAELRAEIDMREEAEFGPDPDALLAFGDEGASRRAQPHTSESHLRTPSSNAKSTGSFAGVAVDEDGNVDECRLCGMDGILLCCDGCPSAYHSRCIGVAKTFIPEGAWFCPECTINRNGPNVTRVTSLRGAEFFGVDPYEQVFLGSCDHLLVMKTSKGEELNIRYYSPVDIQKVLHALTSSVEYRALYMETCKGILQYWEIPESLFSLADTIGIEEVLPNTTEDVDLSTPSTLLGKESGNVADVVNVGNVNGVTELVTKDTIEDGQSQTSLAAEGGTPLGKCVNSTVGNTEIASENGSFNNNNASNVITITHSKEAKLLPGGRCEGIIAAGCVYMGSSFKPQAYLNVYIHGDFAASAAASLAILSSEEKLASQAQTASSHRKMMTANYSLQTKAFSLAAKRFYWPNYEKKLVEVPRERCGWCFSCKSSISSKRGCLLNGAASNAIKGPAKILTMIRQSKNVEASLASIATYILFMEESLCGLTVGPFVSTTYRDQWRKKLEEAATLGEIKTSLLEFEGNIRDIAFSADWIKLVDDMGFENQVSQTTNKSIVAPPQKRGPGRRGRKPSVIVEVPVADADGKDASANFAWWRGGMLSKHVIQKGILPQTMIKHAARHGGCGKINGVQYVDGLLVPKRSRQFFWRAAVEMCKTASQLALQVRYLDLHVRWSEVTCPEQPLSDGKGADAEASVFRNACIIDKKVYGNKIMYGVVFENQKHLPSRVLKNILEVEGTENGTEKNWFVEMRIPLYLIKDFEKGLGKSIPAPADDNKKLFATSSTSHKKRLKSSGKNIFSFLSQKRDNQGKCLCSICQLDVPFRIAARCVTCQGYFHEQCGVGSNNVQVEFLFTCKRCHIEKEVTPQNEIIGDSPTSPLLLQGQESQLPTTSIKVGGKQITYEKALELLRQSSEKKTPATNNSKTSKSGKQNGSEKKPPTANGSKKSSKKSTNTNSKAKKASTKLSFGLIWKKKPDDSGLDFRTRNLLLKDNPNGHLLAPQCHLCMQPYDNTLMYIRCEKCVKWFHADSVDLKESDMLDLIGFKCCRCRRIRIPICPYTDPETRKKLESKKKPQPRIKKESDNLGSDSNSDINDDQMSDWDLDATTPLFESEEGLVNVYEDDSLHSFPKVEQVNDHNLEVKVEPGPNPVSGPGPKKLPVRRHMKESDTGNSSVNNNNPNPAFDFPVNGNVSNTGAESSTPIVQWDVSTNGFEDDMMFDYEDLNYEDMEFEPQTYFSFNELLASDDTVQPPPTETAAVDPSAAAPVEDPNPDQYQMGIKYENQEPMFSVESSLDMMPCARCLQTEPCPDLYCENCSLCIHQHCSPWDETSSWEPETGWKCGNCRDWQ